MYRYKPQDHAFEVLGAAELLDTRYGTKPIRIAQNLRNQIPVPYTAFVTDNAAGVRLRFQTVADSIEVVLRTHLTAYQGQQPFQAAIDLVEKGTVHTRPIEGGSAMIDHLSGAVSYIDGLEQRIRFGGLVGSDRIVEVWLPHNAAVEIVEIVASAPITRAPSSGGVRWTHYGSSISHSALAPSPTRTWPAIAALALGWQSTNLGFAGNAMLDPFAARTIRDIPAELITLKVGINLINYDAMTMRTVLPAVHGFLDTIRDGQPDTPIVLISPIACTAAETTPGPTGPDSAMRLKGADFTLHGEDSLTISRLRKGLEQIIEARCSMDANLRYLDGRELFSEADDIGGHSPDGLHPNDEGTELMGTRFAALAETLLTSEPR